MSGGNEPNPLGREFTSAETATISIDENSAAAPADRRVTAIQQSRDVATLVTIDDPAPPPERFHLEADVSDGELRSLRWMLASLKPRTNIAKAGIAALQRLIGSKVAL